MKVHWGVYIDFLLTCRKSVIQLLEKYRAIFVMNFTYPRK